MHGYYLQLTLTITEIHSLLTPDEAAVITTFFGVDKNGNVDPKYDAHNEFTGKNILMQRMSLVRHFLC